MLSNSHIICSAVMVREGLLARQDVDGREMWFDCIK